MNQKKETMWRMIKFTLFSVSAGIIQIGSFALLHDALGMRPYWIPYLISLVLSVLWNYTFNRKYTFRSNDDVRRGMLLVALYYLVFTPVSTWGGQLLSNAGVHDWLVQGINMLVNFVTEYLFQRFVIYRNSLDSAVKSKSGQ